MSEAPLVANQTVASQATDELAGDAPAASPIAGEPAIADDGRESPLHRDWYDEYDQLPPRPRRKLLTPVTLSLLAVLIAACGFIAGVLVQKGQQPASSGLGGGAAARLAALGRSTTAGSGRLSGLGGFGGGVTVGQVSTVADKGRVLYVTEASGNTVRVETNTGSKITKSQGVGANAIHPGDTVVVRGVTGSNGTIAASTVSDSGAAGAAGGGGLAALFGGGAGGGSAGGASGGGASGSSGSAGRRASGAVNSLFGN